MESNTKTDNLLPKVGLALSGASSRSTFYIGFLEVLKEHDFPIHYIAALSGATVVAASFACGTMDKFKELALKLNRGVVLSLIERSKGNGGLYHLSKLEEFLRLYTRNKNFEDVFPKLGFVTTDIVSGEEVVLQVGDLAKSICASCTLPVVFKPMAWGNKLLIDGGVVNVVPGKVARDAEVDFVIGIDLRATRHVFSPWQIFARKSVNKIRGIFWPKQVRELFARLTDKIQYSEYWQNFFDTPEYTSKLKDPHIFTVIGRSLDIAIEAQARQKNQINFDCDLLITKDLPVPFLKRILFLRFMHVDNMHDYYLEGRKTAEEYLPQMWQMLNQKQTELKQQHQQLNELFIKDEPKTR